MKFLKDLIDEIGDIHVMMVPVGGIFTIDAKTAHKLVRQIEPHVVIPMHYKTEDINKTFNELSGVDVFLKEMDKEAVPENKYTITRETLPEELTVKVLLRA